MTKQIVLEKLALRHFKGVKEFEVRLDGQNVRIYGDNATGKTTVVDAFLWLLFDKDSQNKKDFSIKTLVDGKELHGLEHEVEAIFNIDGKDLKLRKVYAEKWTKKRGSATAEFTGHTVDYFIDDVPSKKKEFTDTIASIIDEEVFKLLTNPSYFNEKIHWKDRRKTLLEIAGDITDEDVIASNKELTLLTNILNGRTIDNHRKVIAARRTEINNELEKIPVRIDEITRSLPDVNGLDKAALEVKINSTNSQIDEKMTVISNIRNGNAVAEKQRQVQEIDMELLNIKRDHESGSKEQVYQLKTRIQEEQSNINIINQKIKNINDRITYNNGDVSNINDSLNRLRNEWNEINTKEFTHESECECPTCGQSLPEDQVNAANEKALAQFNTEKSGKLESLNTKGKRTKERKEKLVAENEALAKEQEKLSVQVSEKQETLKKYNDKLQELESSIIDIAENPQYVAKLQEKQNIMSEIQQLRNEAEKSICDIQSEIVELKSKRDSLQSEVGKFTVSANSQNRINELMDQERELAAEFEKLEQELYLTEEFIRTKVNMLTDKINSCFKYATFKLFNTQINGGLEETCETLYDGVPYSSGLNNAARINVGLDIINTLSKHHGLIAPIFIDNAEAVTKFIDTDAQTISLVVSEADKELRVETLQNESLITVDCEVI